MKQKIYSIVCLFFLATYSFGQNYSDVYAVANEDVRFKMDSNKILGVEILNGVTATHVVGMSGLTAGQKVQFEAILSSNNQITEFSLSVDLQSVTLKTQANLYRTQVEEILNGFNLVLTGYSVTYSLND